MKFKIKPERVTLDSFEVALRDGSTFKPHEDEWIDVLPYGTTMDNAMDQLALRRAFDKKGGVKDEAALERALPGIAKSLSVVIADWNITDIAGTEYEKPYLNAPVIQALPTELLWHLFKVVNGGEDEGKDEGDTSS